MNIVDTIPFTHDDLDYEIRISFDGESYHIRAFLNNKPANGYTYSIRETTNYDIFKKFGFTGINDLVKTAKSDITSNMWEKYLEAKSRLKDTEDNN